jgi:hypothetical protein
MAEGARQRCHDQLAGSFAGSLERTYQVLQLDAHDGARALTVQFLL